MSDAMVTRRARIFRFGDYPAKGFSVTRDQFLAANGPAGRIPIGIDPVNLDHYHGKKSILDGRAGEAAFWVDGQEVWAELSTPPLIMDAAREHDLKLSVVFPGRDDFRLSKVDFVAHPHIPDAVMFSDGEHAVAIFEGDEPAGPVGFCDDEDGKHHAYQSMHDLASHARPHHCSGRVGFAKARSETPDDMVFRQMHHHAVHHGAFCPGMPDGHHQEVGMSDEIQNEDDLPEVEVDETPEPEVGFSDDKSALAEALKRIAALEAAAARKEASTIRQDAVAFSAEVTRPEVRRALPSERKAIEDAYVRAAQDDAAHPAEVGFSEGGQDRQGTRVEAFRALILSRPRIAVTVAEKKAQDRTADDVGFSALDSEPSSAAAKAEAERRERERAATQAWARGQNAPAS